MRVTNLANSRGDFEELVGRFFGDTRTGLWPQGGYEVPTEVFRTSEKIVVRMDLPGVNPDDVEVTMQESTLVINGKREFPYKGDDVQFMRRGTFYGDFTQRVSLGKGLNTDEINARYDNGVLEFSIPFAAEVQPKRIAIEVGKETKQLTS
ncbi:MAG: Hsp20 family protein [Actinobacteria bacterium]|jgi:HSP20 family protein|nr:Hsp20 family protein [Actinomycetota bacterium]